MLLNCVTCLRLGIPYNETISFEHYSSSYIATYAMVHRWNVAQYILVRVTQTVVLFPPTFCYSVFLALETLHISGRTIFILHVHMILIELKKLHFIVSPNGAVKWQHKTVACAFQYLQYKFTLLKHFPTTNLLEPVQCNHRPVCGNIRYWLVFHNKWMVALPSHLNSAGKRLGKDSGACLTVSCRRRDIRELKGRSILHEEEMHALLASSLFQGKLKWV